MKKYNSLTKENPVIRLFIISLFLIILIILYCVNIILKISFDKGVTLLELKNNKISNNLNLYKLQIDKFLYDVYDEVNSDIITDNYELLQKKLIVKQNDFNNSKNSFILENVAFIADETIYSSNLELDINYLTNMSKNILLKNPANNNLIFKTNIYNLPFFIEINPEFLKQYSSMNNIIVSDKNNNIIFDTCYWSGENSLETFANKKNYSNNIFKINNNKNYFVNWQLNENFGVFVYSAELISNVYGLPVIFGFSLLFGMFLLLFFVIQNIIYNNYLLPVQKTNYYIAQIANGNTIFEPNCKNKNVQRNIKKINNSINKIVSKSFNDLQNIKKGIPINTVEENNLAGAFYNIANNYNAANDTIFNFLDAFKLPIILLDNKFFITYINEDALKFSSKSFSKVIDKNFYTYFDASNQISKNIALETANEKKIAIISKMQIFVDEKVLDISYTVTPILDEERNISSFIIYITDYTDVVSLNNLSAIRNDFEQKRMKKLLNTIDDYVKFDSNKNINFVNLDSYIKQKL